MVDEVRLAVLIIIVTVSVPTFIIMSETKTQLSGFNSIGNLPSVAAASSGDDNPSSSSSSSSLKQATKSNPEQALYSAYDAQATEELDRCFGAAQNELCERSVDLIVHSCTNSQVDLAVCHDPRIEQLVSGA
jgi:hypothetical protein